MKNRIIILIILILLMSSFLVFFRENSFQQIEKGFPQKIDLTDEKERWVYYELNEEGFYEQTESIKLYPHKGVVKTDDRIFFWDSGHIMGHSFNFEMIGSMHDSLFKEQTKAVTAYKNNVYVCAEGSLLVFDKNLKEIGRVSLGISGLGGRKNAHDIFIHEDVAYLLDNIMYPIYVLKVNVEDPENPEIIKRKKIDGVNQHLPHHWLDTENNQWAIIQSLSTNSGSFDSIYFFDVSEKTSIELIDSQNIYSHGYYTDWEKEGFTVVSVTDTSPVWAVILKNEEYFIVEIKHKKGEMYLGKEIQLMESRQHDIPYPSIKFENGYVFVIYKGELTVIDTKE